MKAEDCIEDYLECLEWSSITIVNEGDEPVQVDSLDSNGWSQAAYAKSLEDLAGFLSSEEVQADIDTTGATAEQVGHDFCLTRNGHGAGFWDRGYGPAGDRLTVACKPYGTVNVWLNNDNYLEVE